MTFELRISGRNIIKFDTAIQSVRSQTNHTDLKIALHSKCTDLNFPVLTRTAAWNPALKAPPTSPSTSSPIITRSPAGKPIILAAWLKNTELGLPTISAWTWLEYWKYWMWERYYVIILYSTSIFIKLLRTQSRKLTPHCLQHIILNVYRTITNYSNSRWLSLPVYA